MRDDLDALWEKIQQTTTTFKNGEKICTECGAYLEPRMGRWGHYLTCPVLRIKEIIYD